MSDLGIIDYLGHVFICGDGIPTDGQTIEYEPNHYISAYNVSRFRQETLRAIEQKCTELGMVIATWDIQSHRRGSVTVRMFIEKIKNNSVGV